MTTQVRVLTITNRQDGYASSVAGSLREAGYRVEEDFRNEKIGFKIREGRLQKIPYLVIIGAKEESERALSVRGREEGEMGRMTTEEFLSLLSGNTTDSSTMGG